MLSTLFFLIMTVIDWERIFNTYGWPTLVLLVLSVVLYKVITKAIWPRVTKHLDNQDRVAEEARQAIIHRAEKLEEREDTQLASFTGALEGLKDALDLSGRRQEAQAKMMEETLKLVKDTNDFVRRR